MDLPSDISHLMTVSEKKRDNNFGFLRLLFATLVIISHSPELIDGNRSREPLTLLFGTLSFAEVAVDGFFLISGYLITTSFMESASTLDYLRKRLFRIVPGYFACFAFCALIIAPNAGAAGSFLSLHVLAHHILSIARLMTPYVPEAFIGLPHPELNGSMWTLHYEFACYLGVILCGMAGLLRKRRILLSLIIGMSVLNILEAGQSGALKDSIKFGAVFGSGMLFALYDVQFSRQGAFLAVIALFCSLFTLPMAELALMFAGGYLVFMFALHAPVLSISRWANKTDLSYGVYLYAWPIQNLIIWHDRNISPWGLGALTFFLCSVLALLSWHYVEKPSLRASRHKLSSWI